MGAFNRLHGGIQTSVSVSSFCVCAVLCRSASHRDGGERQADSSETIQGESQENER